MNNAAANVNTDFTAHPYSPRVSGSQVDSDHCSDVLFVSVVSRRDGAEADHQTRQQQEVGRHGCLELADEGRVSFTFDGENLKWNPSLE